MSGDAILAVRGVSMSFGGVSALSDVSFEVKPGEIFGLIGPNGAGKSTLFNCMTGFYKPTAGEIAYRGDVVNGTSPDRIAKLGIARTFQTLAIFGGLTVLEHVLVGRYRHGRTGMIRAMLRTPGVAREEAETRAHAERVLELLDLAAYRDRLASTLPHGLQKRVELARALAQGPNLLLLDEPMSGMTRGEKEQMAEHVIAVFTMLRVPVILIEHDMRVLMGLIDRGVVLNFGRMIATGTPDALQRNEAVIEAYLGARHGDRIKRESDVVA